MFYHQEEHEVMFHVSTMLPFNKDDCQQVRNGFGGYEVKHEALGLKMKHGLSCYSSLITYAAKSVPLNCFDTSRWSENVTSATT